MIILLMEENMQDLFILLFGFIIGRFLNVCIYRIPLEKSIVYIPSQYTNGSKNISFRNLFIELTTGIIFLLLIVEYGLSYSFFKYLILVCFLIVIGMIDFDTTDVYLKTTATGILIGIIYLIIGYFMHYNILTYIYGGLLCGGIISIIILITNGMGWGDVEIFLLGGLYFGFKLSIIFIFLSFAFGGLISLILLVFKKKSKNDYIPFGPFIAIAGIFTSIFGVKILSMYLSL
jgi:leader peptidase (prepilin peptidase) / N-methyltransferase